MPYWDDGSNQSKSQYDSSGGYDNTGNQNNNNNRPDPGFQNALRKQEIEKKKQQAINNNGGVDPSLQEAVKKQAKIDKDKKDKEEAIAAGFRTNNSIKYSPPTYADTLKNKFYQSSLNRNKVLAMRKMDLMKKGIFGISLTGEIPEWAKDMSEQELKALGADIQGIKDYGKATYNKNLNPTLKGSGSELLGRVFEGQDLLDNNSMSSTDYQRLFPNNIPTSMGGGGGQTILPYPYNVQQPEEEVEEEVGYDYRLGTGGDSADVTRASYDFNKGGRAGKAEGGIMGTRARRAMGGIMSRVDQRQGYFLGKIVKGVKSAIGGVADAAGKVLKSDLGKAALLAAGAYYMPGFGIKATGGFGNMFKGAKLAGNVMNSKGAGFFSNAASGLMGLKDSYMGMGNLGKAITMGIGGIGLSMIPGLNTAKVDQMPGGGKRGGRLIDPITGKEAIPSEMRASLNDALNNAGGDPDKIKKIQEAYAFLPPDERLGTYVPYETYGVANGGRIGKAEGGLMDLGGMEKDYRAEGGFVPIGEYEKKDDVPARLSVNEFVFTADAVRGAGQGDIDKGAEIMENMMENLENGGTISEESQGKNGAQQMFETSQRLGEVV